MSAVIFDFEIWVSPYRRYLVLRPSEVPANYAKQIPVQYVQLSPLNFMSETRFIMALQEAASFVDLLRTDGHMIRLKEVGVPRFEEERWRKMNKIELATILK